MTAANHTLFRLIYASRAEANRTSDMDSLLAEILADAIPRNRERGLTGLLLAHRGWFIQTLEGGDAAVLSTFAGILGDDRHQSPRVLSEGPVQKRMFPNWNLCARVLSKADTAVLMGYDEDPAFDPAALPERILLRLLAVIAEAHHHRFGAQQRMMAMR